MSRTGRAIIVVLAGAFATAVHPCSQPQIETAFDTEAPTATHIVAVQVESLALDSDSFRGLHNVIAKIRVVKHFRGSTDFSEMTYANTVCSGLRIDVGGIYLIATSSAGPAIELHSGAAPILQLAGPFPHDPDLVLKTSHTIKLLIAALRGERSFEISSDEARQGMSRYTPPPSVPKP